MRVICGLAYPWQGGGDRGGPAFGESPVEGRGALAREGLMWRWLVVVGALGLVASPVGAQAPEGLDGFVGCYAVELGDWAPSESRFHTPPEHVRLTEELGEEPMERDRLLARPVIPHGGTPSAYWSSAGAGGVEVVWTNGYAGVRLHLEAAADGTLEGIARLITDAHVITEDGPEPLPETEAVLRPTACPD